MLRCSHVVVVAVEVVVGVVRGVAVVAGVDVVVAKPWATGQNYSFPRSHVGSS